ncbi:MAG: hypothetical protein KTR18_01240 [Acidiferrobacterales bacterium]|nr:hypothetical protein [Acidiferrobacterales bacterium]
MATQSTQGSDSAHSGKTKHWSEFQEAGTLLGFRFMLGVYKVFGRWVFNLILYPAMAYFTVFRPQSRKASLGFLQTHYRFNPSYWKSPPGFLDVVKHFMQFGHSVLDKLLAWSVPIGKDAFDVPDQKAIDTFHDDPRGQLIIGSHLGNLEFCRGYMSRYHDRTINILLHDRHAANFVEMMRRINPLSRLYIYQVDSLDIGTILELKAKIENGEWLFIAGDRVPLSGYLRTTKVSFLGKPAWLPIGPYLLAKSLGCPVKMIFAFRMAGKIRLEIASLGDRIELVRGDREGQINALAQRFATELEDRCTRAPFQWFNFYDFWSDAHATEKSETAVKPVIPAVDR